MLGSAESLLSSRLQAYLEQVLMNKGSGRWKTDRPGIIVPVLVSSSA